MNTISNVLIDNSVIGVLSKLESEAAWDIAEEMLGNQEGMFCFKGYQVQLICNSLIRYKNRYVYEEELGNKCLRIYNYIISCCRKEI